MLLWLVNVCFFLYFKERSFSLVKLPFITDAIFYSRVIDSCLPESHVALSRKLDIKDDLGKLVAVLYLRGKSETVSISFLLFRVQRSN